MFEQSFVSNAKTRRPWTVLLAFAGQLLAIGVLLAIPLFFVESLPLTQFSSVLLAPRASATTASATSTRAGSRGQGHATRHGNSTSAA